MTLTLQLSARLQERLAAAALRLGNELDEVALDVLEQHAPDNDRRLEAIGFLEHWIDEASERAAVEPANSLLEDLDAHRPSYRKLYPAELKGITW